MTTPAVVLRARRPEDTTVLATMLLEQQPTSGYPGRDDLDAESFVVRPSQVAAWVVEVDGRLAGHVALGRVASDHDHAAVWTEHHGVPAEELLAVSALFVGTGFAGLGLGGRLFDHAVAHARDLGRPVVLDTVDRPSAAVAMYHRRGWQVIARAEQDWLPGGVMTIAMVPPPG